jgi:hypothetical protein
MIELAEALDALVPPLSGVSLASIPLHFGLIASGCHKNPLLYDPVLTDRSIAGSNYKGLHGRVGTIGGNSWFTGAPYFAAMAALTVRANRLVNQFIGWLPFERSP